MKINGRETNNSIRRKEAKIDHWLEIRDSMERQGLDVKETSKPKSRLSTEKLVKGCLIPDPDVINDPTPLLYSQRNSQIMLAIRFGRIK